MRTAGNGVAERRTANMRAPEMERARRRAAGTGTGQVSRRKPQMQKKVGKRLTVFLALTWCLLLFNILFLAAMHQKIKSMDELLNRAAIRLQLLSAEEGQNVQQTTMEQQTMADGAVTRTATEDYPDIWGLEWVDSPVERTEEQVLDELLRLAGENALIAEIYENRSSYPDKLLEALANNPEMAGFVAGYLEEGKNLSGGLTDSEKDKAFPLFLQWDPRWGYGEYGDDSCIGIAGCGPVCISMALYYLTGNENLMPNVIAEYSMANGYYVPGVGTAWALLEDVPALYGIEVMQIKIREENMKNALDEGGVIISSMSRGDFTASGHFIVIYGYDAEGFLVNDPNCVARSREHWSWDRLENQIKNLWVYSRGSGSGIAYYDSPL